MDNFKLPVSQINLYIIACVRISLVFFLAIWMASLLDQLILKDPTFVFETESFCKLRDQYCFLGKKDHRSSAAARFSPGKCFLKDVIRLAEAGATQPDLIQK